MLQLGMAYHKACYKRAVGSRTFGSRCLQPCTFIGKANLLQSNVDAAALRLAAAVGPLSAYEAD